MMVLAMSAIERWGPTYRAWVLVGGGLAVALSLLVLVVAVARAVGMMKGMRERNREEEV